MNRYLIIILLICLFGCSSKSPFFFIGKWQILSIVDNNQDFGLKNNWIHLKKDGEFDSYDGDSDKSEAGKWGYNPKDKLLYIYSNTDEEDDSKWILSMRNDTLIFSSNENDLSLKAIKIE